MLEILGIIWFSRKLGAIAEEKGRKPGRYKFLGVASWVGCEILGAVVGAASGSEAAVYLYAIMFAIVGNIITYAAISSMTPLATASLDEPALIETSSETATA